jgi:hypothetical protein
MKSAGILELFPDLRQKGGTAACRREDDAVDVRRNWARASASLGEGMASGGRQQRDFDPGDRQFVRAERLEARVTEGGVAGVFLDVGEQRPPGFEAADAAA